MENMSMLSILEKGDRIISLSRKKAIALVGLTRVGKSCTYNWILNIPMVGAGNEYETHYQKQINVKDNLAAEDSNGLRSLTLIPNFGLIDPEISLIDMAGYQDNRDYKGVMGVSYFLKSVFEHLDQVKFIIVITEEALKQLSGLDFFRTIQGFLNMFKNMNSCLRTKLYDSTSFLVTRSETPRRHLGFFKQKLQKLSDQSYIIEKKQEIIQFIKYFIDKNRIDQFPNAELNINPPNCTIIDDYNQLGWKYFDIRQAEKIYNSEIINIPYAEDFKRLDNANIALFEAEISNKINSFSLCSKIFTVLKETFISKWQKGIDLKLNLKKSNSFMEQILDFSQFFQEVTKFINNTDEYKTSEKTFPSPREITPITFFKFFNIILSIFDHVLQFDQLRDSIDYANFDKTLRKFSNIWEKLINALFALCKSNTQCKLLQRLKYIITRGIYQFIQFQKIDQMKFAPAKNRIIDNCIACFESDTKNKFLSTIIKSFDLELLKKVIKTQEDGAKFKQLLDLFKNKQNTWMSEYELTEQRYEITELEINVALVKIQVFRGDKNNPKVAIEYANLMVSLVDQSSIIADLPLSINQKQSKQNKCYVAKLKCITKVISILRALKKSNFSKSRLLAIRLAKYVNKIHETCEIYKQMISETNQQDQKSILLQEYAKFCIEWGRFSEARLAFQQKLSICEYSIEQIIRTRQSLVQLQADQQAYKEKYKSRLYQLDNLPDHDPELLSIIEEIKLELNADSSSTLSRQMENPEKSQSIIEKSGSSNNHIGVSAYN